jgi:hypothetical protein
VPVYRDAPTSGGDYDAGKMVFILQLVTSAPTCLLRFGTEFMRPPLYTAKLPGNSQ